MQIVEIIKDLQGDADLEPGGACGVLHESDVQEKRQILGLADDARSLYSNTARAEL